MPAIQAQRTDAAAATQARRTAPQGKRQATAKMWSAAVRERGTLGASEMLALQEAVGNRAMAKLVEARNRSSTEGLAIQIQSAEVPISSPYRMPTGPAAAPPLFEPDHRDTRSNGSLGIPGRHTPVESLAPVQRRAGAVAGADPAHIHAAARRGIAGGSGPLPHLDPIQRSFGRHDVSGVKAHVGGEAARASHAMGATAFATGDHVAFDRAPDLHTAAHEAAHVVQQRVGVQLQGGVGEVGDAYERHADAVADAVVAGRSAESLISEQAGEPQVARPTAASTLQKQETTTEGAPASEASALVSASHTHAVQRFVPKPYMEAEIQNHKHRATNGWDAKKIDELVQWCKSESQYNSYITNLTYKQWKYLSQGFTGQELSSKAGDTLVSYQKQKMQLEVLTPGKFVGYKGSRGTTWSDGTNEKNWSGCYIATSPGQAEGYIGEAGGKAGLASLWKITLKKNLYVQTFTGAYLDDEDIDGEDKAAVLKKILGIKTPDKLIEALGAKKFAYQGPAGEDGAELVVPWSMVEEYLQKTRIAEYTVRDYEITEKRPL